MLNLSTKPDKDEAVKRWEYFWRGELYERPLVVTSVPRQGVAAHDVVDVYGLRYYHAVKGLWQERLDLINRWLEQVCFPGDMIPSFSPDLGPDQWAAFYGGELKFSEASKATNWVDPIIEDWEAVLPLKFDPENITFRKLLDYAACLSQHGEGRYLVGQIDAHSNADALSALRGPERFMMDLYDSPDLIERAMRDVRRSYKPVHESLARAGRMGGERGFTHYGFWHPRSFQVVQSDVICMMGPEHFRQFVMPALEEEFACHEGVYFHLDGPGALRHLDDILSISGHWILQWQSGDGQKPNWQWLDILQKAQQAGKSVHVFGAGLDIEAVKTLHRQLDPARVIYSPDLVSEKDVANLLDWLVRNT